MGCKYYYSDSRRPLRMSASTVADVCVDRCGCLRRPMRISASTDAYHHNLALNKENETFI
ncbi:hypothetical protein [Leyella stercorea]|uniref:hypothetical protein n=1 Tax=Leyella stercorea TaxID=363265 RepID=UPI00242CE4BB|nr:hypothetical protein [Leyella stercorea]